MIIFNGMTSYITVPNWLMMFVLELATIIIEAFIILAYWKLKNGTLRWYEIAALVTGANILTALMGIAVGGYSDREIYLTGSSFISVITITFFIVGIVGIMLIIIMKTTESEVELENHL